MDEGRKLEETQDGEGEEWRGEERTGEEGDVKSRGEAEWATVVEP